MACMLVRRLYFDFGGHPPSGPARSDLAGHGACAGFSLLCWPVHEADGLHRIGWQALKSPSTHLNMSQHDDSPIAQAVDAQQKRPDILLSRTNHVSIAALPRPLPCPAGLPPTIAGMEECVQTPLGTAYKELALDSPAG